MTPPLLYVDTSALLDRVLGQKRWQQIARALDEHTVAGGVLVSSRLLHLEVRRVIVREQLDAGRSAPFTLLAGEVRALPATDEVWQTAALISIHVRTLDSLHLATCQLVNATLLSTDVGMLNAAQTLGIDVHPASSNSMS